MPRSFDSRPSLFNFEWDDRKNRSNIQKHGFDFADAATIFSGALLVCADLRKDYGEPRWIGIGTIRGCVAVIVFAERDPATIRIISLRKATKRERKEFEKAIQDELEAH
jgi:uncharacterized protein